MAFVIVGLVVALGLDLYLLVYGFLKVMVDPVHRTRLSKSSNRNHVFGVEIFILTYLCPIVNSWIAIAVSAPLVACVPWPLLIFKLKEWRRERKEKREGGNKPSGTGN